MSQISKYTGRAVETFAQFEVCEEKMSNEFLAHQIEKFYVLPHVRNSYLTLVISLQAHSAFKCSFLTLVVSDVT